MGDAVKRIFQIETTTWVAGHGFQLRDAAARWSGDWTNARTFVEDTVGVGDGVIGPTDISRAAGLMPVIVELLDGPPGDDDIEDYDGVVDVSIELRTGVLELEGDGDVFENGLAVAPRLGLTLEPGSYRVRVAYANNDTSRYDYADGADHVRLSLWRAPSKPLVVHKKKENEDYPVREYRGRRTKAELLAYLEGPSISHRCLAVVALARQGETAALAEVIANNPFDSVLRTYLAALGFAGEGALPLLEEETHRQDRDLKLRIAQSLRLVGGEAAKKMALELAEDTEFGMLRDAADAVE